MKAIGLGSTSSSIKFYIANRPPLDDYPQMNELRDLAMGELAHIVRHTSNHWRKVFNVLVAVTGSGTFGINQVESTTIDSCEVISPCN